MKLLQKLPCRLNAVKGWLTFNDDGPYPTYFDLRYSQTMPLRIFLDINNEDSIPKTIPRKLALNVDRSKLYYVLASSAIAVSENIIIEPDPEHDKRIRFTVQIDANVAFTLARVPVRKLRRYLERTERRMPTARVHELLLDTHIPSDLEM